MSPSKEKFIPIETISKAPTAPESPTRLVSQEEFDKHRKILDWTFGFIVAVLIVCFTSFVVFVIDAWKFHSEMVQENSKVIEELKKENADLRIANLSKRVDALEQLSATQTLKASSSKESKPTK
jgi:hypothetical protein